MKTKMSSLFNRVKSWRKMADALKLRFASRFMTAAQKLLNLRLLFKVLFKALNFCAILTNKMMFSSQVSQLLFLIIKQAQVTRQTDLLSGRLLVVPQQFLEIASNLVRRARRLLLAEVWTRTKK